MQKKSPQVITDIKDPKKFKKAIKNYHKNPKNLPKLPKNIKPNLLTTILSNEHSKYKHSHRQVSRSKK